MGRLHSPLFPLANKQSHGRKHLFFFSMIESCRPSSAKTLYRTKTTSSIQIVEQSIRQAHSYLRIAFIPSTTYTPSQLELLHAGIATLPLNGVRLTYDVTSLIFPREPSEMGILDVERLGDKIQKHNRHTPKTTLVHTPKGTPQKAFMAICWR